MKKKDETNNEKKNEQNNDNTTTTNKNEQLIYIQNHLGDKQFFYFYMGFDSKTKISSSR